MTVKDTILSFPGLSEFSSAYLDTILTSRAITGAEEVGIDTDLKKLNLAIADALSFAVNIPDFSENKLSVTYPRSYFIGTAAKLYRENGEPEKVKTLAKIKVPNGRATKSW